MAWIHSRPAFSIFFGNIGEKGWKNAYFLSLAYNSCVLRHCMHEFTTKWVFSNSAAECNTSEHFATPVGLVFLRMVFLRRNNKNLKRWM